MRAAGPIENVGKIAVLRANGLGDLMFALPALEALRGVYPVAEVVLLGRSLHAQLLESRPGPVDRVIVLPDIPGVGAEEDAPPASAEVLQQTLDSLRAERFDLAVQMHGGGRHSNRFLRQIGARVTVGLRAPDAEALDRNLAYIYFQPEVARYLELVALAGAPPTGMLEPRLAVTADDLEESAVVLSAATAPVVLHPGATDGRRRWPADRFAAVGDALHAQGADVFVTGDPSEVALVEKVCRLMRSPATPLAGRLSIRGLVGLLSETVLVVANDTGPLHLAAAVDTSTAGVFWCGNLINGGPFTRARHRPAIGWRLHCPTCGADASRGQDCGHRDSFVGEVSPEEVIGNALDLFRGSDARRAGMRSIAS